MKYYSDVTKKMYETISDLEVAEKEVSEKTNARKEDAAKVEAAFNEMVEARKNYEKVLREFCEKHGAYHRTIKADNAKGLDYWRDLIFDLL